MNDTMHAILLVDDEPMLLELLESYLSDLGYHITACGSGKEGLRALTKQTYDVTICDLNMPGIDGLTVVHQYKNQNPRGFSILYTGTGDQSASNDPHVDIFLTKPFDLPKMHHLIQQLPNP